MKSWLGFHHNFTHCIVKQVLDNVAHILNFGPRIETLNRGTIRVYNQFKPVLFSVSMTDAMSVWPLASTMGALSRRCDLHSLCIWPFFLLYLQLMLPLLLPFLLLLLPLLQFGLLKLPFLKGGMPVRRRMALTASSSSSSKRSVGKLGS